MQLYGLILHEFSMVAITRGRVELMGKRAQDYIEIIKTRFTRYFFFPKKKTYLYMSCTVKFRACF